MPVVNPENLVALQRNPEGIRNVSAMWRRGDFVLLTDNDSRFVYWPTL